MVYGFKGGAIICILGNVITLQIILRSKTTGYKDLFKAARLVNFCFKRNTKLRKSSTSKINVACSNTKLFSLCYEQWHIRNPSIFLIRGTRTLEYSKVRQYLDPCQTYSNVFQKKFQAIIILRNASSETILDVCLFKSKHLTLLSPGKYFNQKNNYNNSMLPTLAWHPH